MLGNFMGKISGLGRGLGPIAGGALRGGVMGSLPGAVVGGIMGGLDEDGTVLGGALGGALTGAALGAAAGAGAGWGINRGLAGLGKYSTGGPRRGLLGTGGVPAPTGPTLVSNTPLLGPATGPAGGPLLRSNRARGIPMGGNVPSMGPSSVGPIPMGIPRGDVMKAAQSGSLKGESQATLERLHRMNAPRGALGSDMDVSGIHEGKASLRRILRNR